MRTVSKISVGFLVVFSLLAILGIGSVLADDSSDNISRWRGGPHIGLSPYTGLIGAELQKNNFGLTLGFPGNLGIKYYPDERGYRWFFGAHAEYYNYDDEETKDGIRYDNREIIITGAGFGYKWRWKNHWDLALNLSLDYVKEELENDSDSTTDEYISVWPGISFGYTF